MLELALGCALGVGTESSSAVRTDRSPDHIASPHLPHPRCRAPHSITDHHSEPFLQRKVTQFDSRMKIYQLSIFSTEKIAVHMPSLFRRRCPLVLIVLVLW